LEPRRNKDRSSLPVSGRSAFGYVSDGTRTPGLVLHVETRVQRQHGADRQARGSDATRSADARLEEAVGLAQAIDLDIVESLVVNLIKITSATLLGSGKVEELKGVVAALDIEVVIVNAPLSPVQQRNLERAWDVKILDRTGLILEIFGARAQTREGRLQVELAHLNYQKSRLVRSWTHLERQRGGLGFVGGPGETQIEADRRMIRDRISRIEKQLETVKRTRKLHRSSRKKVPYPIIALVGYTNAGKSTLFNTMTEADVVAEDMLFATLDPTMRRVKLPSGRIVVLSDTVGFISDLPTDLIAAFRATLEEVLEADVIVHVRDITHEDTDAQADDVRNVLSGLGIDETRQNDIVEVWNKIDQLTAEERDILAKRADRPDRNVILASALTGAGIDEFLALVDRLVHGDSAVHDLVLGPSDGAALSWLYSNAQVLDRRDDDDGQVHVRVRVHKERAGPFAQRFGLGSPPSMDVA